MLLRQLREFFPPERHDDIDRLYRRFAAEHRVSDAAAFAVYLHERDLISTETLRDILSLGEVVLSPPPDPRARRPDMLPRHKLLAAIDRGGMGEIFIARDPDLQRTVAVKRIRGEHVGKAKVLQRFFTEAQITAQLDHPSVVPVYTIEREADGRLQYAMKLVRGKTLAEVIRETRACHEEGRPLDEAHSLEARLELLLPVCNAVAYAHRRGILHRDLKPDNVMVGAFGEVQVMDWGIARPLGEWERVTEGPVSDRTRPGSVVGTPHYMSPEQAQGHTDSLGPASDQYALGLILYELVTLQRAIEGDTQFETVLKAAAGEKRPIVHVAGKRIPRELAAIIRRATAVAPGDRYPSVTAFAEDVRRFLRDEEVAASPDNAVQKVQRWISHHRAFALGAGVAIVLLAFLVTALVLWRSAVALEAQREASVARERALMVLSALVNDQAHRMDARLYEYEALVTGLAFVAEDALQRPAPPAKHYLPADFADPERAPPDLRESKVYKGDKLSLAYPDFVTAPGVDPATLGPRLDQLATLTPTLRRVVLESHGPGTSFRDDEEAARLILDEGVPLIWAYVATEEGVLVGYPGLGIYPEGYDPRERDWYEIAKGHRRARWGAAEADESGMGLLMTAGVGLYDDDDRFLGVAAIDLTFDYLIDELLDIDALEGTGEIYLISREGRVVVRSTQKHLTVDFHSYKQPPFQYPALLPEFQSRSAGHLTFEGDDGTPTLAVWGQLDATSWTYLLMGPEEVLIDAAPAD